MYNLTGLVLQLLDVAAQERHVRVLQAVRSTLEQAGYTIVDAAPESSPNMNAVALHVGIDIDGFCLITHHLPFVFDETWARMLVTQLQVPGALFCVRDYGYQKGKQVSRGAFLPLHGKKPWVPTPRRANNADDVWRCIAGLVDENPYESRLWPAAHLIHSRPGTTIWAMHTPTPISKTQQPKLFPTRDTSSKQDEARRQNEQRLAQQLRPRPEYHAADSPHQILTSRMASPMPDEAEAILDVLHEPHIRAEIWVHLVIGPLNAGELEWNPRTARLMWMLSSTIPNTPKRHPAFRDTEEAVLFLCRECLKIPGPEVDDDVLLAASRIDLAGMLDRHAERLRNLCHRFIQDTEPHVAAHAALILVLLNEQNAEIRIRAQKDINFIARIGVHSNHRLMLQYPQAFLALFDIIQPYVIDQHDTVNWTHAQLLWLSDVTFTDGFHDGEISLPSGNSPKGPPEGENSPKGPPEGGISRLRQRIDLALQGAPKHKATLQNAILLAERIKDHDRAQTAAELLRRVDAKHAILAHYPSSQRRSNRQH